MDIKNKKILTENEFIKIREFILKSTYQEIKENIFSKYGCNNCELKQLNNFGNVSVPIGIQNDNDYKELTEIMYLHKHVNSNYWMLLYNIKGAISDAHIEFNDYNGYLITKINNLKLSFILWLSFSDSIKHFLNSIDKKVLQNKNEIKNILLKYSDGKNIKNNTKILDFSEFKSFPIFDDEKWKRTFRDFANDLKHNDDLLINLKYELMMKHTIKERYYFGENEGKKNKIIISGGIKTNIDDFNKFYYGICVNSLIEATDDLVDSANFILNYLKKESKFKTYFN